MTNACSKIASSESGEAHFTDEQLADLDKKVTAWLACADDAQDVNLASGLPVNENHGAATSDIYWYQYFMLLESHVLLKCWALMKKFGKVNDFWITITIAAGILVSTKIHKRRLEFVLAFARTVPIYSVFDQSNKLELMRAVQDRLEQGDAPYQPRDYFKRLAPFWLIVTDYEWMLNSGGEPFWFGPSPDPERIATPAVMAYFKSEAGYSPPWLSTPDISAEAPIASDGDEATAEHQPSRKKKRRQLIGGKTLEERLEKGTEQWCGKVENQLAGLYAGRHRESHKRR